ncbi:glutathione S-transferase family protein [Erwinia persicina]|uniref:Glutathione S-transferase family protein n=1 Tax=Erwinia persicina TaxID=55211 RepID=A0A4U3F126_9GAMM|nr:glutathione S-transferase family protein [Erwinia persicina]TKJ85789.1 glutathione S-transferase family protein [Erwinia persicina]
MKIYTYPQSRSLRVLWALEEVSADYEAIKVDLFSREPTVKSPHACGKVPFLIDGNISLSEALAICVYICEQHSATSLYPSHPKKKASVNSWLSFALTDLESPLWNFFKLVFFTPENQRSPDLMNYFRYEAVNAVSLIHLSADHEWIAGESFTLADIFMTHTLLWAKKCGIEMDRDINDYIIRTMSRPAFLRAQEKNNC